MRLTPTMIWGSFAANDDYAGLVGRVYRELGGFLDGANRHDESLPHVTLARFKDAVTPIDLQMPPELPPLEVSSFTLFESELGPSGPRYTEVATFPLSAEPT